MYACQSRFTIPAKYYVRNEKSEGLQIQQSSAASTQHSKSNQAAKLQGYEDLTPLPWDCSGPRHSDKRAGIHWIFMTVKHDSTLFWAMCGTALKNWGESQIIIAIQAPLFSLISLTCLGKALLSPLSFQSDSNKTGCGLFSQLGDSKSNPCTTSATKIWRAMPPCRDLGLFFPPISPTAPVLLYLSYTDTRRESSPLCLDMYKAIIQNARIFLQRAVSDQLPLLCHLKEDKCPMR